MIQSPCKIVYLAVHQKLNIVTIGPSNSSKYIPKRTEDTYPHQHKTVTGNIWLGIHKLRQDFKQLCFPIYLIFFILFTQLLSHAHQLPMTNDHFLSFTSIVFFCVLNHNHLRPFLNISNLIFSYFLYFLSSHMLLYTSACSRSIPIFSIILIFYSLKSVLLFYWIYVLKFFYTVKCSQGHFSSSLGVSSLQTPQGVSFLGGSFMHIISLPYFPLCNDFNNY